MRFVELATVKLLRRLVSTFPEWHSSFQTAFWRTPPSSISVNRSDLSKTQILTVTQIPSFLGAVFQTDAFLSSRNFAQRSWGLCFQTALRRTASCLPLRLSIETPTQFVASVSRLIVVYEGRLRNGQSCAARSPELSVGWVNPRVGMMGMDPKFTFSVGWVGSWVWRGTSAKKCKSCTYVTLYRVSTGKFISYSLVHYFMAGQLFFDV